MGMLWKLRRIAAGYRQQDVSTHCGISMARYRAIERGEIEPTDLDRRLIEKFLPPLPTNDPPASECVPAGGPARADEGTVDVRGVVPMKREGPVFGRALEHNDGKNEHASSATPATRSNRCKANIP
jgi:hypothetical protein